MTSTVPFLGQPLATPALAEAKHAELGQQLENYLAPLVEYCEQQPQNDDLDVEEFRHGQRMRQALDALLRYDEATSQLLAYYRTALTYAQQLASIRVPSLEQALGLPAPVVQPPRPAPVASSRPVAPAPEPPSGPLTYVAGHRVDIAAVQRFLASPAMQARAALPPTQRLALARISSYNLPPHAQS